MNEPGSISGWIARLQQGEPDAAALLWERFVGRVEGLARRRLHGLPSRFGDHRDLAQEVFAAVFEGIQRERFREMNSRDDLWQVLALVTARRAANCWRKASTTNEIGTSGVRAFPAEESRASLEALAVSPDDVLAQSLASAANDLLRGLDPKLREVALLRLKGYTNAEIAAHLNRSVKSVERYLQMIRESESFHRDGASSDAVSN